MTPDVINAVFEGCGALLTAKNTLQVIRDRGYAGIYLPAILFFFSWGGWNLYFYPMCPETLAIPTLAIPRLLRDIRRNTTKRKRKTPHAKA